MIFPTRRRISDGKLSVCYVYKYAVIRYNRITKSFLMPTASCIGVSESEMKYEAPPTDFGSVGGVCIMARRFAVVTHRVTNFRVGLVDNRLQT